MHLRFKKVLKTILKIGNQLNDQEGAERQAGFTVDSLLKLQNAKAFDKKTSILQYVVTLIHRSDVNCLYFNEVRYVRIGRKKGGEHTLRHSP